MADKPDSESSQPNVNGVSDGKRERVKKNPKRRNAKRRANYALDKMQEIENELAEIEGRPPKDVIAEHNRRKAREDNIIDAEVISEEINEPSDRRGGPQSVLPLSPPRALIAKNAEPQQHSIGVKDRSTTAKRAEDRSTTDSEAVSSATTKHHETQQDSNRDGSKPTTNSGKESKQNQTRPGGRTAGGTNGIATQQDSTSDDPNEYVNPYPFQSVDWWEHCTPAEKMKRCRAITTSGNRCRQFAIQGGRVCRNHGGLAPHVKLAARNRLENAADRMAAQLLRMATDDDVKDSVKLTAIRDALDRAGLKAPEQVVVSAAQTSAFEDVFQDIGGFSGIQHAEPGYVEAEQTEAIDSQAGFNPFDTDDGLNDVDYQQDSNAQNDDAAGFDDGLRSADGHRGERTGSDQHAGSGQDAERSRHDGPYDPPAARRTAERHPGASQYRSEHVTGDDAITAANQANRAAGALKALPPGRRRHG